MSDLLVDIQNILEQVPVQFLPFAVLALAFVGSPHCLMMCGPICYMAGHGDRKRLSLYHSGRLLSYLLVGAVFGYVGQALLATAQGAFLVVASTVLGILFLVYGVFLILQKKPLWLKKVTFKSTEVFVRRVMHVNDKMRAFLMGTMSGFLPCGFLFTFLLAAMATQSPWLGSALLFMFWLGTVPMLSFGVYFLKRVQSRVPNMQKTFRYAMGVMFIIYGAWVFTHRLPIVNDNSTTTAANYICH